MTDLTHNLIDPFPVWFDRVSEFDFTMFSPSKWWRSAHRPLFFLSPYLSFRQLVINRVRYEPQFNKFGHCSLDSSIGCETQNGRVVLSFASVLRFPTVSAQRNPSQIQWIQGMCPHLRAVCYISRHVNSLTNQTVSVFQRFRNSDFETTFLMGGWVLSILVLKQMCSAARFPWGRRKNKVLTF